MTEKLRKKVIEESEVLENGIIRMTSFFNHTVDARMMRDCGIDIASRFAGTRVTKVLTAPTSGLLLAQPLAVELDVPFIYTRGAIPATFKGKTTVDITSKSHTTSKEVTLSILKEALSPSDCVLIADDIIASGHTMTCLASLVTSCGATVAGFAALLEKSYQPGRSQIEKEHPGARIECLVKLMEGGVPLTHENVLL
eukprot:TRINITY_DN11900_c2_g2_i1.p1 TRINITY_DN11900_c2_g2~~TRINITY_DN11900_c2_g2_i1.p1  ORF type:complete len:209 (+),score=59.34 TRINITY_DN11900_c2_g2_i1:39-629(+)